MKGNVTQHKREGFQGDFLPKKGEEKKCWDILRAQPPRAERSLHRVTSERHARLFCLFVKSFSFFFFFLSCFSKLFSCQNSLFSLLKRTADGHIASLTRICRQLF